MPLHPRHREQRSKNLALFGVLIGIVLLLLLITVVKLA